MLTVPAGVAFLPTLARGLIEGEVVPGFAPRADPIALADATIYLPTRRTISVDASTMAAGARAAWVDPTSGDRRPVPMSATFTTPGANAGAGGDWLLVLRSPGPA